MAIDTVSENWEVVIGDESIKKVPQADMLHLGHSSGNINWLIHGKDLRVGAGGGGSLDITAIKMPNNPEEFLTHLKLRVNPKVGYYHRGQYVVVLAVPNEMYKSTGYHPESNLNETEEFPPMPMKNVQLIEKGKSGAYALPTRFILGYYDGSNNSFHFNPAYEKNPEPTEFGVKAEQKMQDYVKEAKLYRLKVAETTNNNTANQSHVVSAYDDDDEVW